MFSDAFKKKMKIPKFKGSMAATTKVTSDVLESAESAATELKPD
jgi:hypothetical protein